MDFKKIRTQVGESIKNLRKEKKMSQTLLARELNMSQAQLSAIESGRSSLTGEQLIYILQIFNVTTDLLIKQDSAENIQNLQYSVKKLGDIYLKASSGPLNSKKLYDIHEVIRETLVLVPSPEIVTALCPVIIRHIEVINAESIAAKLADLGIDSRLWWLIEGSLWAVRNRLLWYISRDLKKTYQEAQSLLTFKSKSANFFFTIRKNYPQDLLAWGIDSEKKLELLRKNTDGLASRWRIITPIKAEDFTKALQESEEKK